MDAIILTLIGGFLTLIVAYLFWRRGQFEDVEDIKYEIFRNE